MNHFMHWVNFLEMCGAKGKGYLVEGRINFVGGSRSCERGDMALHMVVQCINVVMEFNKGKQKETALNREIKG